MKTSEQMFQEKLGALKRDIQVGLDSGESIPGEQVFAELKKRNEALRRKKKLRPTADPDDNLTPEDEESIRRGIAQMKRGQTKPWRKVKSKLDR